MTITTTFKATVATARDRWTARRRYFGTEEVFNETWQSLYSIEHPIPRGVTLGKLADICDALHDQHVAAFGDTLRAETLAANEQLLSMAASCELQLARSTWKPVDELRAGDSFEFAGEWAKVLDVTQTQPAVFQVRFAMADIGEDDGGIKTLEWDAGETVRTSGADRPDLEVTGLACGYGITGQELTEWQRLATTADRDHRAGIYATLADLAEQRLGTGAAETLRELAATEVELIRPVPLPKPICPREVRAFFAVVLAVFGAQVAVLAQTPVLTWPWFVQFGTYALVSV
ncbi:hypothetical protein SAMN04489712_1574, partial [Thermomonospora echinospora]